MPQFVEVVFPLPLNQTFTYSASEFTDCIEVGHRVLVPFKQRTLTGFVVDFPKEAGEFRAKNVDAVLDEHPVLTQELIDLAQDLAKLHGRSIGETLQTLLPPGLIRQTRRMIRVTRREDPPSQKDQQDFWLRVKRSKGLDYVHALKRIPGSAKLIRTLEEGGWVYLETILKKERAQQKKRLWVSLTEGVQLKTPLRGKQQIRFVEKLKEHRGECFLDDLRKEIPEARRILGTLYRKNLISFEYREGNEVLRPSLLETSPREIHLTEEQKQVISRVQTSIQSKTYKSFLLYGVTGSGKTEVYLRLAKEVLKKNQTVLALVPEISLTPQFVSRFQARFGETVAVLHSGRNESERLNEWMRVKKKQARLVIGTRSAVFAPLQDIGLIILDEEHDGSYKQEEGLLYDARQVAKYRAQRNNAVILRGSATPSMESFTQATLESGCLLELPKRVTPNPLPDVNIVDLRSRAKRFGDGDILSEELREGLTQVLERKERAILFLNRRGFSPVVLCPSCGVSLKCEQCAVSLTFHQNSKSYLCHYCGFEKMLSSSCPDCGHQQWVHLGVGTERVVQELSRYFPDANVLRMDRDAVRKKDAHEKILAAFARGEGDILVGTQMVTKGLDVPQVSLVGVLLADQSLHFPDFRASERTFQLLTQVIGRAGRGNVRGHAIIQTFQPDHYSIRLAATQNYREFYEKEIKLRAELSYPPCQFLSMVELASRHEADVRQGAMWLGKQARQYGKTQKIEVLGPSPAPLSQVSGWYRYHLLLRSQKRNVLGDFSRWLVQAGTESLKANQVILKLDLQPQNFL